MKNYDERRFQFYKGVLYCPLQRQVLQPVATHRDRHGEFSYDKKNGISFNIFLLVGLSKASGLLGKTSLNSQLSNVSRFGGLRSTGLVHESSPSGHPSLSRALYLQYNLCICVCAGTSNGKNIEKDKELLKKLEEFPGMVAHACHPSSSGG